MKTDNRSRINDRNIAIRDHYQRAIGWLEYEIQKKLNEVQGPSVEFQDRLKDPEQIEIKATEHGWIGDQIFENMKDEIGLRLLCNHLDEAEEIHNAVLELKGLSRLEIKEQLQYDLHDRRSNGYRGINIPVVIDYPMQSGGISSIIKVSCEVQIQTYLQRSWAELAHGLTYKPASGYHPSEPLQELFITESDSLYARQQAFDKIRNLVEQERQEAGGFNLVTLRRMFLEQEGESPSHRVLADLYQKIKANAPIETIDEVQELLNNKDHQKMIERTYLAVLQRPTTLAGRLLYGALLRTLGSNSIHGVELSLMTLEEFRNLERARFDFGVIGRTSYSFTAFGQFSGGWATYHTGTFTGSITTEYDVKLGADCVVVKQEGNLNLFRIVYPAIPILFPAKHLYARMRVFGDFFLNILVQTDSGRTIFIEFRTRPVDQSVDIHPDGTIYLPSQILPDDHGILEVKSDLLRIAEERLPDERIQGIQRFFFATTDMFYLKELTLSKE